MPFIDITVQHGVLPEGATAELTARVLDAQVAVEGEGLRQGIGVTVREAAPGTFHGCAAFARVTLIREALSGEQRGRALAGITEAIVGVVGEPLRAGVWAVVEESVHNAEWSIGGNLLTFEAMDRLRAGRQPWPAGHDT